MTYGEPQDVPGQCNARLSIGDNYGDNHATIVCQLPQGHDGLHREVYPSFSCGLVTITWEKHDESYDIELLEHRLESSIHGVWEQIPERDFEFVDDTPESHADNPQGYTLTVWTRGDRKIGYRVVGKDAVVVGDSEPLSEVEALKRIIAALGGAE